MVDEQEEEGYGIRLLRRLRGHARTRREGGEAGAAEGFRLVSNQLRGGPWEVGNEK